MSKYANGQMDVFMKRRTCILITNDLFTAHMKGIGESVAQKEHVKQIKHFRMGAFLPAYMFSGSVPAKLYAHGDFWAEEVRCC